MSRLMSAERVDVRRSAAVVEPGQRLDGWHFKELLGEVRAALALALRRHEIATADRRRRRRAGVPDVIDAAGTRRRREFVASGWRVLCLVDRDGHEIVADLDAVAVEQAVGVLDALARTVDEGAVARKVVQPITALFVANLAVTPGYEHVRVGQRPVAMLPADLKTAALRLIAERAAIRQRVQIIDLENDRHQGSVGSHAIRAGHLQVLGNLCSLAVRADTLQAMRPLTPW